MKTLLPLGAMSSIQPALQETGQISDLTKIVQEQQSYEIILLHDVRPNQRIPLVVVHGAKLVTLSPKFVCRSISVESFRNIPLNDNKQKYLQV